jgi:hypothetical protein
MVTGATAEVAHRNGCIRSTRLIAAASSHALRITGPPTGTWGGTRFYRRVKSDFGFIWFEQHPRATYE